MQHLREQQRAQRRKLAGLEDDRAPGGERRRDLRGDLVERPVPWRDQAANADRLAHDRRRPLHLQERVAAEHIASDADMGGREGHLRAAGEADRRAHFERNRLRERLGPLEDQRVYAGRGKRHASRPAGPR